MLTSYGRPPQLVSRDDDVNMDNLNAYLHFEDKDHILRMPNGAGESYHEIHWPNLQSMTK